ncbi:hypothetical protein F5B22DRAFT_567762 [Xylaria bambusicola]|uniref:uncharacterized protein n=1 Tax=Xylaria bambusicola TaxID=326684 RepID=UPI0020078B13|nr:uncharacterized protein F5B22DRAFT_567762 [Xylaria bambusicola]KAI0521265.1 hypothetical protein F5B22DRAFT_567762 [Xylaria bambusicola]
MPHFDKFGCIDNDLLAIGQWVDGDRAYNQWVKTSPRPKRYDKLLPEQTTEIWRRNSASYEAQYTRRSRRGHCDWRHDLDDEFLDSSPKDRNMEVRTTQTTQNQDPAYRVETQGGQKDDTASRLPVLLNSMQCYLRMVFPEASPYLLSEGLEGAGSPHPPEILGMTKDCKLLEFQKLALV